MRYDQSVKLSWMSNEVAARLTYLDAVGIGSSQVIRVEPRRTVTVRGEVPEPPTAAAQTVLHRGKTFNVVTGTFRIRRRGNRVISCSMEIAGG